MPQVVLQPAAGPEARVHFRNTIDSPVPLTRIRPHMSDGDYQRLARNYEDDEVWVWGARPGVYARWARIQPGDIVLFYREKTFIRRATVTFVCQNRELALDLWGEDSEGETWEYVFFLDHPRDADIAVEDLARVVGYASNYIPYALNVLDQAKSDQVLQAYLLDERVTTHEEGSNRLEDIVDAIDVDPDHPSLVNVRGEQTILRQGLLNGRRIAPCSICGELLPADLLIAAHIKRRSECTRAEKLDPQIVVLMCKLGCDSLYEYGYLSVVRGVVVASSGVTGPARITQLLGRLHGREFLEWTDRRAQYFGWHEENVLKTS